MLYPLVSGLLAAGCVPRNHVRRRGCVIGVSTACFSVWSWSERPRVDFSIIRPEERSVIKPDLSSIPAHIQRPAYVDKGGRETAVPKAPVVWSIHEIEQIRASCQLARAALQLAGSLVRPGLTTDSIDAAVRTFVLEQGAYPSPLAFKGFPKSISCSVNNVAAHGIPDSRALVEGDILNIDVTVFYKGFHGDCSDTFGVGEIDSYAAHLLKVAKESLDIGISCCGPDQLFRNIGQAIHKHTRAHSCTTVPIFLGHGIGTFFHGPPDIYHCRNNYPGRMQPGMVFTVEPCVSEGDRRVRILADGWTALTMDDSRTAQVEHTVLITETGAEILTL